MASCMCGPYGFLWILLLAADPSCAYRAATAARARVPEALVRPSSAALSVTRLSRFDRFVEGAHAGPAISTSLHWKAAHPGTVVSTRQFGALLRSRGHDSFSRASSFHHEDEPSAVSQLADMYGTEYAGLLGVGTARESSAAAAELAVIYDTGSADLWVASDYCNVGPCSSPSRRQYDHSTSATYRAPQQGLKRLVTTYGSGKIEGFLANDDVRIGTLMAKGQGLGLIADEDGQAFEMLPFEGIVGLGFPTLASSAATPFFDTLIQQHAVPKNEFAMYLHHEPAEGGAILWGGSDSRLHKGPLAWFPVVEERYWALDLLNFRVGNYTFEPQGKESKSRPGAGAADRDSGSTKRLRSSSATSARNFQTLLVVDSGTTFFTAEGETYAAIRQTIGDGPRPCEEIGHLPPLVYTLRNAEGHQHEIAVPPEEYMVRGTDAYDGFCAPAVVSVGAVWKHRQLMILGEVFMRHYFTVFRRGALGQTGGAQVGFARADHSSRADGFFDEKENVTKMS